MTDPMTVPFVVAMAQPAQGQGNILIQLFPFVLMIGIFYLLVLMPARAAVGGYQGQEPVVQAESGGN